MSSIRQTLRRMKKTPFFKQNMWSVYFQETGSQIESSLSKNGIESFNEDMSFLAQRINIPFRSFEYDYDRASKKHFVKKYNDFEQITISLIETEDFRVRNFIKNWENIKINTLTGEFRAGVDPRKDIIIEYHAFKKSLAASLLSRVGGLSVGTATNNVSGSPAILSPVTNISVDQLAASAGVDIPDLLFDDVATFTLYGASFVSQTQIELDYEGQEFTRIDVTLNIENITASFPREISEASIGQLLGF